MSAAAVGLAHDDHRDRLALDDTGSSASQQAPGQHLTDWTAPAPVTRDDITYNCRAILDDVLRQALSCSS